VQARAIGAEVEGGSLERKLGYWGGGGVGFSGGSRYTPTTPVRGGWGGPQQDRERNLESPAFPVGGHTDWREAQSKRMGGVPIGERGQGGKRQ